MEILFVSSVSSLEGGAERSLLELAGALRDRGHGIALACWRDGALTAAFERLGTVYTLGTAQDPGSPLGGKTEAIPGIAPLIALANSIRLQLRPVGREARWLASSVDASGADLIHTNCDLSPIAGRRAARTTGVPWVAHVRDNVRSWFHPRVAPALRNATTVVAPSDYLAEVFRQRGIDTVVVPNPVAGGALRRHLDADERRGLRTTLGLGPVGQEFAVAVVGRLDLQKGTLRIIDAARWLRDGGDARIRFLLAGTGPAAFERRLRAETEAAGVADSVRLLGYRDDVPDWLPAVDALAVPSTEEAFGRIVVEGMHAGLPVVAFRHGGAAEIIEHNGTGILVAPPGSPTGGSGHGVPSPVAAGLEEAGVRIGAALLALAGDPDQARRLGAAAQTAAARYEPAAVVETMERIYSRSRSEGRGARR